MKLKRRKAINKPQIWTTDDEKLLMHELQNNGFNSKKLLTLFPNRSLPSIRSKVRKLRIKHDFFGFSYRDTKCSFTSEIAKKTAPKVVFDAYAGAGHQTFIWGEYSQLVFAAESMKSKLKQFSKKALKLGYTKGPSSGKWHSFEKGKKKVFYFAGDAIDAAADLNSSGTVVDLIDLDTCGSTLPTIPFFLLLLKPKHLLVTHGEFHSMRFKREDVLRRILVHRDASTSPLPLSVNQMSMELDKAVKMAALRAHNDTNKSYWLTLKKEIWLGNKFHGMLRRYYSVSKPPATADCLNILSEI